MSFGAKFLLNSSRLAVLLLAIQFKTDSALAAGAEPIELSQPDGSNLVLNAPAARIVSLSPHLAELVYAAGAGERLAATVEYSEFPPEAAALPRVGDAFRIDIERVHMLEPDLILAWASGNPDAAMARLDDLGFNVWRIEIREPGEIADMVEMIGRAAGTGQAASETAGEIRNKINAISSVGAGDGTISWFYQVAEQPLYTVNGEHLISRGLELCGGRNVFAGLATLAPQIGIEAVLTEDPRLLIGPDIKGQPDPLAHWRSWPRMRAVREDNFLLLDADAISRATPRFIDALVQACTMLDKLRTHKG